MYTVTTYFKLEHFYSRPCGRGDLDRVLAVLSKSLFLLTPLREGRLYASGSLPGSSDFYSRPCGRGDFQLRRTRQTITQDFYSRPCGRGDPVF